MAQKAKKKRFIEVDIPIINKTTQILAYEIEELNNRFLKYDLTRILKGKSIELSLGIKVNGDEATAYPLKATLIPYFLRRMMRKGTNYVEESFSAECNDAQIRIKPFLITRKKVSRAVRKALRNKAKEELIAYVKDKSADKIFEEVIHNKMQRPLSIVLKKIYPLSLCEIRVLKIEKTFEQNSETKTSVKPKKSVKELSEEKIEEMNSEQTEKPQESKESTKPKKERAKKTSEKETEEE